MDDKDQEISELKSRLARLEDVKASAAGHLPPSIPKAKGAGCGAIFAVVFALFVVALIASSMTGQKPSNATSNTSDSPTASNGDHTQPVEWPAYLADDYVKPHLKDPDSAKISNVTYRERRGIPVLCGYVNSKNGFGGYTGDEQFISLGKQLFSTAESESASRWAKTWNEMCVNTDESDDAAKQKRKRNGHAKGA